MRIGMALQAVSDPEMGLLIVTVRAGNDGLGSLGRMLGMAFQTVGAVSVPPTGRCDSRNLQSMT